MTDMNCLSYWFPLIQRAGLPVPRTEIVRTDLPLGCLLDGYTPKDGWHTFLGELCEAAKQVGRRRFLRTGHISGKHNWDHCCNLRNVEYLPQHVANLVEWSHIVDMLGLPMDVWVVREMLDVEPLMHLPGYGNMPVVREYRVFVEDGKTLCLHPYWPKGALLEGVDQDSCRGGLVEIAYDLLCHLDPEMDEHCRFLAEWAVNAVGGGYWSVDILCARNSLYVTDMALGQDSYHWEGCPAPSARQRDLALRLHKNNNVLSAGPMDLLEPRRYTNGGM